MELDNIITKDDLQSALENLSAQEELLYKDGLQMETAKKAKQELEKTREKLTSLTPLVVTLAFRPSSPDLSRLHKIFEDFGLKSFYLDVAIDTSLIAGIKFTFNGKYFDHSIAPVFDKYWETKRYDLI